MTSIQNLQFGQIAMSFESFQALKWSHLLSETDNSSTREKDILNGFTEWTSETKSGQTISVSFDWILLNPNQGRPYKRISSLQLCKSPFSNMVLVGMHGIVVEPQLTDKILYDRFTKLPWQSFVVAQCFKSHET